MERHFHFGPESISGSLKREISTKLSHHLCKMNPSEKLCLQWNDFKDNISSSFGELREDQDLTDVTLACEDGKQVEAHKVILAASSPFFMDLLKRNRHPHPLIYMRGLKSEILSAIVDFLYFGEAKVFQENPESFLAIAEELKLTGLTGTGGFGEIRDQFESDLKTRTPVKKEKLKQSQRKEFITPTDPNTTVALENNSINTDLHELDEQIKSMMKIADIRTNDGHRLATCNEVGFISL